MKADRAIRHRLAGVPGRRPEGEADPQREGQNREPTGTAADQNRGAAGKHGRKCGTAAGEAGSPGETGRPRDATAQRQEGRVRELEAEIDDLLREKEEVEKWATLGSA